MTEEEALAALERDMANLVFRHPTISGRDFQAVALRICDGYYDDHDPVYTESAHYTREAEAFAKALARELRNEK